MAKKKINFSIPPDLPKLEEEVLQFWEKDETFKKSVDERPAGNAFVFYDGPPFATGLPHYGHLLASTTKDVIPRYQTMRGKRVERVWGWDCHGLPIENMIEQKLGIKGGKKGIEALGIDTFNAACRAEVLRLDKEWEKTIGRLGRWVDFKNDYKTMDATFMESVWWGFKQLWEKGLIYKGKKVILYCPRCATPLSNFEIAMDDSYTSVTEDSTVYKFKVMGQANTYVLAWSTTPWNKLATPALAVNPSLEYVKVRQKEEYSILAEKTLSVLEGDFEIVDRFLGTELTQLSFEPHYDFYAHERTSEKFGVIIADDFVTAEEGTGVVTLAIYGEDDYRVMATQGVQLIEHVDDQGRLKPEVTPWAGMDILKVNSLVNEDLQNRGLIYKNAKLTHSVPLCYRCSTRLYYAPLPAWFVNVQQLKETLISENEKINWVPNHLKHGRFLHGLENAPDWNISRSRYWGTPMPVWVGTDGQGKELTRIIGSVAELKEWAVDPKAAEKITDLHREFLDDIEVWVDDDKTVQGHRIPEVFDCWVESGSMPFASRHYPFHNRTDFEKNYPAQFISEYIAQTRAWFYTMHVLSVGIFGVQAFENVLTTGTILAEDGSKMSKSKKNYPDPELLLNEIGADSLRLYLMSSAVMKSENLHFSEKEVADIRRKIFVIWWNILGFYHSFATQDTLKKPASPSHVLDRWILSRLQTLIAQTTRQFDEYEVARASRTLMEFVSDLSNWYLRLSRERLKSTDNTEVSQVFGYVLYTVAQLFAPLTPFFSELVHQSMVDEKTSIHLTDWPEMDAFLQDTALESSMETIRRAVEMGHAVRKEQSLKVRQPLASATITVPSGSQPPSECNVLIEQELNVKKVVWKAEDDAHISVQFDTKLTPELKEEGEAREIMRTIQGLRRKSGLKMGEAATAQLPSWPVDWQEVIEAKTATRLVKGETVTLITE